MSVAYTIGYEGSTTERFIAALAMAGVQTVVDVRELPLSRKKGFSKRSLSEMLAEVGINYVHMRDLGDPRKGREAARSGDFKGFQRIFRSHFGSKPAQLAFKALVSLGRKQTTCMMCFERDPRVCHRDIIAGQMKTRGFTVIDLYADEPLPHERVPQIFKSSNSCEGVAAAE